MTASILLAWMVRLAHMSSAIGLLGAPFFVRFAFLPAAGEALDEAMHARLREKVAARWRHLVYVFITLLIVTGLFSFFVETRAPNGLGGTPGTLVTGRWREFSAEDQKLYQMLFGIKVLCAFIIFFLASALTGRSRVFEPIRKNARTSLTLLLLLGLLVVICATLLHFLPLHLVQAPIARP